jgi:hypothetical protein
MKGFIFTMDMMYGILSVVLLLSILVSISSVPPQEDIYQYQIQARDSSLLWALTGENPDNLPESIPAGEIGACDIGFRRVADINSIYSPGSDASWEVKTFCAHSGS